MTDEYSAYDPELLPEPVLAYLDAHDEARHEDAASTFASGATVLDDGRTYRGIDEIDEWIRRPSGEFEYAATRIGQLCADQTHTTVQIRLDGTFPGGTVTLRYRFELAEGKIMHLSIGI